MVRFYPVLMKADNHDNHLPQQERYRAGERVTIPTAPCTHCQRPLPTKRSSHCAVTLPSRVNGGRYPLHRARNVSGHWPPRAMPAKIKALIHLRRNETEPSERQTMQAVLFLSGGTWKRRANGRRYPLHHARIVSGHWPQKALRRETAVLHYIIPPQPRRYAHRPTASAPRGWGHPSSDPGRSCSWGK